ncbi:MAG: hypothetical protein ACRD36_08835, partial [Candidatus Acidiferrum sp.]
MEVIFLDNGLIGRGEHSYSLLKQVAKSLARRGLRSRAFGAKAMDRSVAAELGAIPHFNYSLYSQQWRPLLSRILRFEWDPARSSELATWQILNDSFEQDVDALPANVWSAGNLLVFPGLSQNEVLGLIRSLLSKPEGRRPRVVCQLMFPPNWTTWGRPAKLGKKLYRKAFALARPLIGKTLFFATENAAIGRLYQTEFGIDAKILPVPFGDAQRAAPCGATPTFGFFGYSKSDKGFHLLPRAIEICRARGAAANFTIQLQHSGWEPATVAAEEALRRIDGVR